MISIENGNLQRQTPAPIESSEVRLRLSRKRTVDRKAVEEAEEKMETVDQEQELSTRAAREERMTNVPGHVFCVHAAEAFELAS